MRVSSKDDFFLKVNKIIIKFIDDIDKSYGLHVYFQFNLQQARNKVKGIDIGQHSFSRKNKLNSRNTLGTYKKKSSDILLGKFCQNLAKTALVNVIYVWLNEVPCFFFQREIIVNRNSEHIH